MLQAWKIENMIPVVVQPMEQGVKQQAGSLAFIKGGMKNCVRQLWKGG